MACNHPPEPEPEPAVVECTAGRPEPEHELVLAAGLEQKLEPPVCSCMAVAHPGLLGSRRTWHLQGAAVVAVRGEAPLENRLCTGH